MVAASREMVGICREVVNSKKRMNEIISSWSTKENLCMFISIVRMFTLKQWSWITVSMKMIWGFVRLIVFNFELNLL